MLFLWLIWTEISWCGYLSAFLQLFKDFHKARGFPRAWMETFTSPTSSQRTPGKTISVTLGLITPRPSSRSSLSPWKCFQVRQQLPWVSLPRVLTDPHGILSHPVAIDLDSEQVPWSGSDLGMMGVALCLRKCIHMPSTWFLWLLLLFLWSPSEPPCWVSSENWLGLAERMAHAMGTTGFTYRG